MAMCVIAVVGAAPCQCFSPGENQTTSPGRISSMGPPSRCAQPQPAVTMRVWPSGCLCHAVRAAGSNVTMAPPARAGVSPLNGVSIRTEPVKYSAGPFVDGCEPLRLMSIAGSPMACGVRCFSNSHEPIMGPAQYGLPHGQLGKCPLWHKVDIAAQL